MCDNSLISPPINASCFLVFLTKDRKREYPLKSPGIKPQARHGASNISNPVHKPRVLPTQLPSTATNHTDGHDNDLSSSETDLGTPPTPSTPMTPPHDLTDSVSVFDGNSSSKFLIYSFFYLNIY